MPRGDGRTDRPTDGADCNILDAFLIKRGDNDEQQLTHNTSTVLLCSFTMHSEPRTSNKLHTDSKVLKLGFFDSANFGKHSFFNQTSLLAKRTIYL